MGPEFFQTRMGQKFYDATMPRLAKAVEKLVKEMERQNDLKEIEMGLQPRPAKDPDFVAEMVKRMDGKAELILKGSVEVQKACDDSDALEQHGIELSTLRGSAGSRDRSLNVRLERTIGGKS
jgi:hypothetical protein